MRLSSAFQMSCFLNWVFYFYNRIQKYHIYQKLVTNYLLKVRSNYSSNRRIEELAFKRNVA